jgi:hypothetical protein
LINLAKAIGRIVVSYKDMQNLAGYTTLIHEMDEVLDDLRSGTYVRTQVVEKEINTFLIQGRLSSEGRVEPLGGWSLKQLSYLFSKDVNFFLNNNLYAFLIINYNFL